MKQEVNLHQRGIRKTRSLFSARVAARIGLMVVTVLMLIYAIALVRFQVEGTEYRALEQQREATQRRLEEASQQFAKTASEPLQDEVDRLQRELEVKRATRLLVSTGELGPDAGFSRQLSALARQRLNGLWLTRVQVSAGGKRLSLEGAARDEELVPQYIKLLANEPALEGLVFNEASLRRDPDADVPQLLVFQLRTHAGTQGPQ